MGKIYSPSSTSNFLQCQWLWKLSQEGWRSKEYGKNDIYALRGSAVSAGADAFHRGEGDSAAYVVTKNYISEEWERSKIASREWREFKSLPLTQTEVVDMACSLVQSYMEAKLPYKVIKSEYEFTNHGKARADIIGQLSSGLVLPIDLKCKDKPAQAFYEYITKRDFAFSHQMCHYMNALCDETGSKCLDYGIVILWYGKKNSIEYIPFSITQERMDLWLASAQSTWARMEQVELGIIEPSEAALHKSVFGPCIYYKACLEQNRNPKLMESNYFKIVRN